MLSRCCQRIFWSSPRHFQPCLDQGAARYRTNTLWRRQWLNRRSGCPMLDIAVRSLYADRKWGKPIYICLASTINPRVHMWAWSDRAYMRGSFPLDHTVLCQLDLDACHTLHLLSSHLHTHPCHCIHVSQTARCADRETCRLLRRSGRARRSIQGTWVAQERAVGSAAQRAVVRSGRRSSQSAGIS